MAGRGVGPVSLRLHRGAEVWEVRLDRAAQANALSADLVDELLVVLDELASLTPSHRPDALVLRGNERHFAAGFDLGDLATASDASLAHRFLRIGLLLERLTALPVLTVAVVEGTAVGAGADLALACDHRIGTRHASFRFPGPRLGIALGTARLVALAGGDTARRLLSGAVLTAVAAQAHGLLTEVTDTPEVGLADAVRGWAGVDPGVRTLLLAELRPHRNGASADAALASLARSVSVPGLRDRVTTHAGRTLSKEPA